MYSHYYPLNAVVYHMHILYHTMHTVTKYLVQVHISGPAVPLTIVWKYFVGKKIFMGDAIHEN